MSTTQTAAPARPDLVVDEISVRFGTRQVLDRASCTVSSGHVVGLLGPNGAGKTTLMRVMFGIVEPDSGAVKLDDRPATDHDRSRWGYMPQERGLYLKMRVTDHLEYLGRLRGLERAEARERAEELLDQVGLAERAGDKVEQLSGGMQQRVQLAAALVHRPEVLVLDEPFAGLDPVAVEQLSSVIQDQADQGRTVVFSSHQLDLVEDLCERIVLLHEGRVVLEGDLATLRARSEHRVLRIGIEGAPQGWAERIEGITPVRSDANETLLQLDPGTDALAVLDHARRFGRVQDFGLELPRLSQLFLEVVQ